MKVILTGAFGFLGKAISNYFANDELIKLGRSAGDVLVDLTTKIPALPESELVIHAAGKAHLVPKTEIEKAAFFDVNVNGTANLLSALERSPLPKYFVLISSVSVYGLEEGEMIREDHPLLAEDPYGKSKIAAEELVVNWCQRYNIIYTILRLPLLAGPNPPGNLGAMIKAVKKGFYFNIGKGAARRSMVRVEDVAKFIDQVFAIGGTYNLSDGEHPSFKDLSVAISKQFNKISSLSLPYAFVKTLALMGDLLGGKFPITSKKLNKMTKTLTFSDQKARVQIGWKPTSVVDNLIL